MALLNPPEVRPSVILLVLDYLAQRRGQHDELDRLIDTVAPPSLSKDAKHQLDVRVNIIAATELGLVVRSGTQVSLGKGVAERISGNHTDSIRLLRDRVFADQSNVAAWGEQVGARDLTNALAWYLTFSASTSPTQMEGGDRSAKELQEADFGPRQPARRGVDADDDGGGWPISNPTRWNSFGRWACSLGFAWVSPKGRLVPDPTPAVRAALGTIFENGPELTAADFALRLGEAVPVLDAGKYREFVEQNWLRQAPDQRGLSPATTEALERLRAEGRLEFDDRADAPRVARADGSTFSHVRHAGQR